MRLFQFVTVPNKNTRFILTKYAMTCKMKTIEFSTMKEEEEEEKASLS